MLQVSTDFQFVFVILLYCMSGMLSCYFLVLMFIHVFVCFPFVSCFLILFFWNFHFVKFVLNHPSAHWDTPCSNPCSSPVRQVAAAHEGRVNPLSREKIALVRCNLPTPYPVCGPRQVWVQRCRGAATIRTCTSWGTYLGEPQTHLAWAERLYIYDIYIYI